MTLPDFSFEKKIWKKGYQIIGGVDEVGRGCFAGPVVAGCVVFDRDLLKEKRVTRDGGHQVGGPELVSRRKGPGAVERQDPLIPDGININDSKKLSAAARERASFWIKRNALCYGIGSASVAQINKLGIKKASEIAFRKAISNCRKRIDYLLIDAFYIPYVKGLRRRNQLPIIKGDTKSLSIAAASIIAKVYRDKLMTKLGINPKFKKYGWDKNKGYGTLIHRNAIKKYGITRYHRKKFVETYLNNSSFSRAR